MMYSATTRPDEAASKGAVEDLATVPDPRQRPAADALASQLGHRDQDEMLKDGDTDFPEPDAQPEHSGQ
jgi:hypothetical protein